jgi:hypothetical protein
MSEAPERLYYTRRDAAQYIKNKFGIPVGRSRIAKDAMDGKFPRPLKVFGKCFLYEPEQLDEYAETLLEEAPQTALEKSKRGHRAQPAAGTPEVAGGRGARDPRHSSSRNRPGGARAAGDAGLRSVLVSR